MELHLHLHEHVLGALSPAHDARLDAETAEELVERVAALPRNERVRLRVRITAHEPLRDGVEDVIRHHFARMRERTEAKRQHRVRAGRYTLIAGSVVLIAALAAAEALRRIATGGVTTVIGEGLTIVGWVALWRPLDLLLFERWELNREVALYRRIEQAEIELEPRSGNTVDDAP